LHRPRQSPRGIVSSLAVIVLAAAALVHAHNRPPWTDVIQIDASGCCCSLLWA